MLCQDRKENVEGPTQLTNWPKEYFVTLYDVFCYDENLSSGVEGITGTTIMAA